MRRGLVIVLVVCCVLSGAALAVPTTDGDGVAHTTADGVAPSVAAPATNTTAYLTISPDTLETASYQRPTLDVSGSLALDARRLDGRFSQLTLDERFAATDSTDARRAQLRESAGRIERRIADLRERQSAAIRAYNNGSLPARGFVLELVRIDTAAGQLETAADRVAARARPVPQASIDGQSASNWARNRGVELAPLQGPVRDRITEALRGENTVRTEESRPTGLDRATTRTERPEPLQVYVETSQDGLVLATVDDDTYYREALLPGERNATGNGLNGITDALDRVSDRYPWAWNNSVSTDSSGDRRGGIYRFGLFHGYGQLTTFLDRDSGRVFAEQQQTNLLDVPTAEPVNNTDGNLRLTVNRTHPTGPLELSLSTPDGEPVDGRVAVGNQSLERTGPDGTLWTVAPRGEFTVVARANDEAVRVATNATPPSNRTVLAPGVMGEP